MTLVYEPVCHGAEHAPFNAALLATILEAWPGEPVSFCSESSQGAAVRAMLDAHAAAAVRWKTIAIPERDRGAGRHRLRAEWYAVEQAAAEARASGATRLIASAITPTGLAALKCHMLGPLRHARVAVVHHSGLARIMASRSTRALLAVANGDRLRHVVLGRSIRRAITAQVPSLARSVVSMRHPYLFPHAPIARAREPAGELRFAFLGLASRDKGFERFCRLAARIAASCSSGPGAPHFELIGRLSEEFRTRQGGAVGCGAVETPADAGPMPRAGYEQRVRDTSYAIFPYAAQHYGLVSSGAMLDAFVFVKPCIALRNPLFEEYFDAMGDIGYLCDSEDEMFDVVRAIATARPADRYLAQCRNIIAGRRIFAPPSVARELKACLEGTPTSSPVRLSTPTPRFGV